MQVSPVVSREVYLLGASGPFAVPRSYFFSEDKNPHYQLLANGLSNLTSRKEGEEQVFSPEVFASQIAQQCPILTGYRKALDAFAWYDETDPESGMWYYTPASEEDNTIFDYYGFLAEKFLEQRNGEAFSEEEIADSDKYFDAVGEVLNHAVGSLKDADHLAFIQAIDVIGMIAIEFKPMEWSGITPKKHKNETEKEFIFRKAHSVLSKYAGWQMARRDIELVKNPDRNNVEYRRAFNISTKRTVCKKILDFLKRDEVTNEGVTAEVHLIAANQDRYFNFEAQSVDITETQWTILPPEVLLGIPEPTEESGGEGKSSESFVDMERMRKLAELAMMWGNGAKIAIANLERTGNYDYRAAILPETKDGLTIEHAVAENPASGNATYVFRAEAGLGSNDTVVRTWEHVLNNNKRKARALGARKILHTEFGEENIMEYLTRPAQDLQKPGYKR